MSETLNVCTQLADPLYLVGTVLSIIKFALAIIIVVLGIIDLAKIVISSKPEEIKKGLTGLLWRIAGAVLIIFLPTIIMAIFGLINGFRSEQIPESEVEVCKACINKPWSDACPNGQSD